MPRATPASFTNWPTTVDSPPASFWKVTSAEKAVSSSTCPHCTQHLRGVRCGRGGRGAAASRCSTRRGVAGEPASCACRQRVVPHRRPIPRAAPLRHTPSSQLTRSRWHRPPPPLPPPRNGCRTPWRRAYVTAARGLRDSSAGAGVGGACPAAQAAGCLGAAAGQGAAPQLHAVLLPCLPTARQAGRGGREGARPRQHAHSGPAGPAHLPATCHNCWSASAARGAPGACSGGAGTRCRRRGWALAWALRLASDVLESRTCGRRRAEGTCPPVLGEASSFS